MYNFLTYGWVHHQSKRFFSGFLSALELSDSAQSSIFDDDVVDHLPYVLTIP